MESKAPTDAATDSSSLIACISKTEAVERWRASEDKDFSLLNAQKEDGGTAVMVERQMVEQPLSVHAFYGFNINKDGEDFAYDLVSECTRRSKSESKTKRKRKNTKNEEEADHEEFGCDEVSGPLKKRRRESVLGRKRKSKETQATKNEEEDYRKAGSSNEKNSGESDSKKRKILIGEDALMCCQFQRNNPKNVAWSEAKALFIEDALLREKATELRKYIKRLTWNLKCANDMVAENREMLQRISEVNREIEELKNENAVLTHLYAMEEGENENLTNQLGQKKVALAEVMHYLDAMEHEQVEVVEVGLIDFEAEEEDPEEVVSEDDNIEDPEEFLLDGGEEDPEELALIDLEAEEQDPEEIIPEDDYLEDLEEFILDGGEEHPEEPALIDHEAEDEDTGEVVMENNNLEDPDEFVQDDDEEHPEEPVLIDLEAEEEDPEEVVPEDENMEDPKEFILNGGEEHPEEPVLDDGENFVEYLEDVGEEDLKECVINPNDLDPFLE